MNCFGPRLCGLSPVHGRSLRDGGEHSSLSKKLRVASSKARQSEAPVSHSSSPRARFFLFSLSLSGRPSDGEPVCCRSSYLSHALLPVLFFIFVSSPSSSPDRSLQACDPSYLACLTLYVPVAPCLCSYKIANVLKCLTTIPTFFSHSHVFPCPLGRGLVSPLLSNSRRSPHRFSPFTWQYGYHHTIQVHEADSKPLDRGIYIMGCTTQDHHHHPITHDMT